MQLSTIDTKADVTVHDEVFNTDYNEGLIHQAVVTYMSNSRCGTKAQKTRSEVRGGGKKPWRQKGTGRARAGTIRSPIWRSGGVTFAAKTRDYSKKLNKKMYKSAMKSIISELQRNGSLVLVSDFQCPSNKTKDFLVKMKELELTNALVVLKDVGEEEYLASRNLLDFEVSDVAGIDPVSLLMFDKVVVTEEAIKMIEEQLQ